MYQGTSRRRFLQNVGLGSLGVAAAGGVLDKAVAQSPGAKILGEAGVQTSARPKGTWRPVSERKIRVGIAGFGVCGMGGEFSFHLHPNVTVAAVSDLVPQRCQRLAKVCLCQKTYPSLEEMLKDDSLEAIFLATDPPGHAGQCIDALKRGKHVACCVPAVWGSLEEAHKLLEAVKSSGRTYMMFETSAYHADCYAMRQAYQAGALGKLYCEAEYFHYMPTPIDSFRGWRIGLPPQWYATHSNAYYVCVTGGSFTEVSCMAAPSIIPHLRPENNRYKNPFGTEVALLRTSEGGMARMAVSWDTLGSGGEQGRVRGQRGAMWNGSYAGPEKKLPDLDRPPLPPAVVPGGHGGSHGNLMNEFVAAILENRKPYVDVVLALNMTVAGIVAHQSALKGGELLKVPQFTADSGSP